MPGTFRPRRRDVILGAASVGLNAALGDARAAANYAVALFAPIAKSRTPATAKVTLETKGAYVLLLDYPLKLVLAPPPGLSMPKTELRIADATRSTSTRIELPVAYTAAAPGNYVLSGSFKFALSMSTVTDSAFAYTERIALNLVVQ